MTEEWKVLTDVDKVPYVERSDREKARYGEQRAVYNEKKSKELAVEKAAKAAALEAGKVVGQKRPATHKSKHTNPVSFYVNSH